MGVSLLVPFVEQSHRLRHSPGSQRHAQLERLPHVPHVQQPLQPRLARRCQVVPRGLLQRSEQVLEPVRRERLGLVKHGRRVFAGVGSGQCAERGEYAGMQRHQHLLDLKPFRQLATVHRAGATEWEHGEVPRVEAALERDHAQRSIHVRIGHRNHRQRRATPRGVGAVAVRRQHFNRAVGSRDIKPHPVSERRVRGKAAQDQVRVGHRGLGAASTIGGGTG